MIASGRRGSNISSQSKFGIFNSRIRWWYLSGEWFCKSLIKIRWNWAPQCIVVLEMLPTARSLVSRKPTADKLKLVSFRFTQDRGEFDLPNFTITFLLLMAYTKLEVTLLRFAISWKKLSLCRYSPSC